ncbi:transposase [Porticoccus sp. W117]|uniref:transposase n=1 Tax=Porticoccus sp. W117 TaxID=3054777 RepID=UPI002591CE8A|nr:transposase [Porticoccus sp. W117]MDM3870358.1 transposase [Porticoccus sp. W117]
MQRVNNRSACFYTDDDYLCYLDWLKEYSEISHCQIHSYVLMTNHVHLLLTPESKASVGNLMRRLGQRYVQYINRTYKRSGTLWEGRFKSCITNEEDYVLGCYRYIELNPVRADMVSHPAEYRWSSYRANAQGESNELIVPQYLYSRLGTDASARMRRYRELFRHHIDPGLVGDIRQATNGNYALGSERFKDEIELAVGRRVRRGVSGRPKKKVED